MAMNKEKSDALKEKIILGIRDFVKRYSDEFNISTKSGTPLVGFADASHPYILSLKEIIGPLHSFPTDVLDDAVTIIAYYVPFTNDLAKTNLKLRRLASPEWALAYEQTNKMFGSLNTFLIEYLANIGYTAAVSKEATTFHKENLISNWSQRHFAYTAGLGTFGLNNMLITKRGCCGRYSTVVTNLDVEPDAPLSEELCIFKKSGNCGICVKNCPMGAFSVLGYERQKCYSLLRENAKIYTEFGSSYVDEKGRDSNSEGSEVCGKCITSSPCAFWKLK
jgi:epoxyqueuosine reductase QueG